MFLLCISELKNLKCLLSHLPINPFSDIRTDAAKAWENISQLCLNGSNLPLKSKMMKHLCQAEVYKSIVSSGSGGLRGACYYILPFLYQIFPWYLELTWRWTSHQSISINPSSGLTVPSSPAVASSPASQILTIIKAQSSHQRVLWWIPFLSLTWEPAACRNQFQILLV